MKSLARTITFETALNDKKKIQILFVLIFILGVLLRIIKFFEAGPVSFDEAWSFWVGSKDVHSLLRAVAVDKHPPLFYLLMHFWNVFHYSEKWIRIPSLLASIVNLPLFYLTAKKWIDSKSIVLIAFFFFALSFDQIRFGAYARMYTIASSLTLVAVYAFFQIMEGRGKKWFFINAASNLLLVATHYVGVYVVIIQLVFLIIRVVQKKSDRQILFSWALGHLPLVILGLTYLPTLISQLRAGGVAPKWITIMMGKPSVASLCFQIALLNSFESWPRFVRIFLGMIIMGLMVFFLTDKIERTDAPAGSKWGRGCLLSFYLVPVVTFWVISRFEPVFVGRYFIPFQFVWYIFVPKTMFDRRIRGLGLVVGIILLVLLSVENYRNIVTPYPESNWRVKSSIIKENWQKGDALLIVPVTDLIRFRFYAGRDNSITLDKGLLEEVFRSRPNQVTTRDLEYVFLEKRVPYSRLWFHEETGTGLSAEFFLQNEGTIYNFLNEHFAKLRAMDYVDEHGRLSLFILR